MGALTREAVVRRIVERADLERFAERILDTFWDNPDFQRLRPPREAVRTWVRWNLELMVRWLAEGRPPSDSELEVFREHARARAAEGVPADVVPANFRRGARFAWRALLDAATEEERSALVESADLLFEYVDRVSRIYYEAYEEVTAAATTGDDEAGARELLRRIASDETPRPQDRRLAERLGFELDRAARPIVVSAPAQDAAYHFALAAELRRRGMLAVSEGQRVVGLTGASLPWTGPELGRATFACGAAAVGVERARALDELCETVEVAVAAGTRGQVSPDDYLPQLVLRRSPRIAARIADRVYGPLTPELRATLDLLIEHHFERNRTAAALPVHRNTLRDRIHRISALTGVDLDSAPGRGLAWLAWLQRSGHS
jgi:hypothetical protein